MKFSHLIDLISEFTGRILIFLMIPMIFVTVYDVILRYFFGAPTIWAYETTWMIYAAFFVLSGGYTLLHGGHISVDVLFLKLSPRTQAFMTAIYLLVLLMPFTIVVIIWAVPWAWHSTMALDCAEHTTWRPYLYPIKWTMPIGFFLLALQGLSEIVKNFHKAIKMGSR